MVTGIIRKWLAQRRARGAAVPFESPALRLARVCDDERDGLIAVLRDFANNGTAYIVPWSSLPLMAPMTDHDKAVHAAVGETRACTPAKVRAVIAKLALSGALGPEAKAREGERSRADQRGLADIELILILHLLDRSGADLATLMADPARWRDRDAKAAVAEAATAVGVKRQDIYRRIGEFTKLLGPVGLVTSEGSIKPGWLRVLHDEIEGFAKSTAMPASAQSADAKGDLAAIADAAKRTAQLAGMVLNMLDYAVLDIGGTIRRWTTELPVLRQAIERLSLTLDVWPPLMKSVRDALRHPPDQLTSELHVLRSMLPLDLPIGDSGVDDTQTLPSVADVLCARLASYRSLLAHGRG
jgi:hypothetical protein